MIGRIRDKKDDRDLLPWLECRRDEQLIMATIILSLANHSGHGGLKVAIMDNLWSKVSKLCDIRRNSEG